MPGGTVDNGAKTVSFNATNELGQVASVVFGDRDRTDAFHPVVHIGMGYGAAGRIEVPGTEQNILKIDFANAGLIGAVQVVAPTEDELRIEGSGGTLRMFVGASGSVEFELTIFAAPTLGNFMVPFDVTLPARTSVIFQPPLLNTDENGLDIITGTDPTDPTLTNVVRHRKDDGAFALYGQVKNNRRDGFGNLSIRGTGKLGQFARLKMTDSVGEFRWSEIERVNGETRHTFNGSWMRDPARVLPFVMSSSEDNATFGYTTIGGTTVTWLQNGFRDNLGETGDIESVSLHNDEGVAAGDWKGTIYTDDADYPDAQIGIGAAVAQESSPGWGTSTLVVAALASADYYVGAVGENTYVGNYDSGIAQSAYFQFDRILDFTSPEDPFPAGAGEGNFRQSVYATYTATGAPASAPSYYDRVTQLQAGH